VNNLDRPSQRWAWNLAVARLCLILHSSENKKKKKKNLLTNLIFFYLFVNHFANYKWSRQNVNAPCIFRVETCK
jgi:hypothetical protein